MANLKVLVAVLLEADKATTHEERRLIGGVDGGVATYAGRVEVAVRHRARPARIVVELGVGRRKRGCPIEVSDGVIGVAAAVLVHEAGSNRPSSGVRILSQRSPVSEASTPLSRATR